MGYYYAKYMCEYGVKLIGVAGTGGCIYNSKGNNSLQLIIK